MSLEGARVLITGRSFEKLEVAKNNLGGCALNILPWDVSEISLIDEKLRESKDLLGGTIDVLVNNAGVIGGANQLLT